MRGMRSAGHALERLGDRRVRVTALAVAALAAALTGALTGGSYSPEHKSRPATQRSSPISGPAVSRAASAAAAVAQTFRPFTKGLLLGVYTGGQPLTEFDAQVGRAALTVTYVHFGTPVTYLAQLIATTIHQGAEPILEFEPGRFGRDTSQIAAGTGGSDSWLRQLGQTIRALGYPVAISFFPEMNGPWHKAWSSGPSGYVQAYRHVHAVLAGQADSLITWFWQPSAIHKDTPDPMPWWPGPGYVDVAAMDSYYYYKHDMFDAVFGRTIALIRRADPGLPIMIGETAAGPLFGRQVTEIDDLFAGIRRTGLIGLVWFNQFQHKPPYQFHQDWRLQDHPAALAAFRHELAVSAPLGLLRAGA